MIEFKIFEDSVGKYLVYIPESEGGPYGYFVDPHPDTPPSLFPLSVDFYELCENSEIRYDDVEISYRIIEIDTFKPLMSGEYSIEVKNEFVCKKSDTDIPFPEIYNKDLESFCKDSIVSNVNDFPNEGNFDDFD